MAKNIAGLGRKRPQLNIPVELLDLDPNNPRLAKESQGSTQLDLLQILEYVSLSQALNLWDSLW